MLDDATEVGEPASTPRAPSVREQLASGGSSHEREPATLERGAQVGRYLVLGRVGRGGMGEVFAAHDPELDRRVALKLLHVRPGLADDSQARARMAREAQAMARLNHPNTVTVHDVGEHEGRVFLAMEFVEGQTLGGWLKQSRRGWREVVAVFTAAGRGLAAAHAAGLIHRDFKPDNVMLTETGRVLVMDFGLARAGNVESIEAGPRELAAGSDLEATVLADELDTHDSLSSRSRPQLSTSLTQAGALLGTPAYMAPEQLRGGNVDARSDQWAFCVAFWEALHGQRPFPSKTMAQLIGAVLEDRSPPIPRGRRVPTWLHRLVLRGLARKPEQRWPSLDVLLAELEQLPRRRRRRATIVGGLALASVVGLLITREPEVGDPPCRGGVELIEQDWDDAARAEVRAELLASRQLYAADTWTLVETELDRWGRRWAAAHRDTCEATELRHEQSDERLDARMQCLAERRRSFAALISNLRRHGRDQAVVEDAALRVKALPDIDRCGDPAYLQARIPPPEDPELATEVERTRERLIELHSKPRLSADELAEIEALRERALVIEYPPLLAEIDCELGERLFDSGRYTEAIERFRAGYFGARRIADEPRAITCGMKLVFVLGNNAGQPADALAFAEHVEPDIARLGSASDRAELDNGIGLAQHGAGDYEAAERSFERALELRRASGDPLAIASTQLNLGRSLRTRGQWDDARIELVRALEGSRRVLGQAHPRLALILDQLGLLESQVGELERAERHFQSALALRETALGPEHVDLAFSHNNLGRVQIQRGEHAEALTNFEAALKIWQRELGPEHADVARGHSNVGVALRKLGRYDEAREHYERAMVIYEIALGPDHDDFAIALHNLGNLLVLIDDPEPARELQTRALAIWTDKFGPEHVLIAHGSVGLADALHRLGEHAKAIAAAERGLEVLAGSGSADVDLELAGTVVLAQAELALGHREQSLAHADRVLALLVDQPESVDVTLQRARVRVVLAELLPSRRRRLLEGARIDYAALPGPPLPEAIH